MNAAIRAVVRSAAVAGIEVIGFRRGYEGLIRDLAEPLSGRSVANMIQRGGTFLETSRSPEFRTPAARGLAARNLRRHQIEALIVVGGEGSMIGATLFGTETGVPVSASSACDSCLISPFWTPSGRAGPGISPTRVKYRPFASIC